MNAIANTVGVLLLLVLVIVIIIADLLTFRYYRLWDTLNDGIDKVIDDRMQGK